MKLRKLLSILLALMMTLALCACNQIGNNGPDDTSVQEPDKPPVKEPYPVSVYGVELTDAPESVVSLSPALTMLAADLGVTGSLVGISEYCSLPGLELPTVGSPADPDIEAIIELKPQVVMTLSPMASTDKINLSQYGISVMEIPSPESYAELCDIYINIAKVFYGNLDYKTPAHDALAPLDDALKLAKDAGISKKFIIIKASLDGGLMLAGEETLESDLLGGFGDNALPGIGVTFMEEDLLSLLEPSVIFAYDSVDREDIRDYFEDQKIVFISEESFSRPSAQLADVILELTEELK